MRTVVTEDMYITISADGSNLVDKRPVAAIRQQDGSLDNLIKKLQNSNNGDLLVELYKPNGSSFKRSGYEIIHPDGAPGPALGSIAPPIAPPAPIVSQPLSSGPNLWKEKCEWYEKLYKDAEEKARQTAAKYETLYEKNRELETKIATANREQELALQSQLIQSKATLNGILSDVTKTETLEQIKDIIGLLKSEGGSEKQLAPASLLSGFTEDMKPVIESFINMMSSLDEEQIAKLVMTGEAFVKNPDVLESVYNQLFPAPNHAN